MSTWERRLAIGCLLAGVVLIFLGLANYLVQQQVSTGTSYPVIAGIALVISYAVLDPGSVRDLVGSRRARFGSLSVLVMAIVIGIVTGGNVLAARGTQSLDLTRYKVNTLAPQSVQVTQRLEGDAQVTFWDNPTDSSYDTVSGLLHRYEAASPRFRVTVTDPNNDPATARRQGVAELDTIVIQYQGKSQVLGPGTQGEQDITAALLKLESTRTPSVCWAGGDGEVDLKNTDPLLGYSEASDQVQKDNFSTQDLVLTTVTDIPTGCDVVAIVRPTKSLPDPAVKAMAAYLAAGGRLLLALDPWQDAAVNGSYNAILAPYGLSFDGGLVVPDPTHHAANEPTALAVLKYGTSPIAKGLDNRVGFFPESTAINSATTTGVTVTPVASTTSDAFAIEVPRQPPFTRQSSDKAGPFTVMETAELAPAAGKKSRVVVVGTGAFAENEVLLAQDSNIQLLTGSLAYLTDQEQLISIPAKPSSAKQLSLTQDQQNLNLFITLLLMPLLVAVGGLAVWWRRRLA